MSNVVKTTFLLTALTLLLVFFGQMFGGRAGMMVALVLACFLNFGAYWFSDKMVLAMYRARPVTEAEAPEIYAMVRELAHRCGLPMPRIYVIPSATPNAFATGRDPQHAVVAVTEGIVNLLSGEELKGVLAHELAHVAHRDILISSVAATLAGAVTMIASMARWALIFGGGRGHGDRDGANPFAVLVMSIVVPIAAALIQLAVSRQREYAADEKGGKTCGNPLYLASALRKLEKGNQRFPMRDVQPATAHLFIMNPLQGGGLVRLFSTHPPLEERIARLERQARTR